MLFLCGWLQTEIKNQISLDHIFLQGKNHSVSNVYMHIVRNENSVNIFT